MSLISKYKHPMNRFDELFNRLAEEQFPTTFSNNNSLSQPRVNIKENDDTFELEVAAPGLNKEDFTLNVQNNYLTVKVEQKQAEEVKEEKYMRQEFSYTSFSRSFQLSDQINADEIVAKYENGILQVTLPKQEKKKADAPKLIDIH